MRSAGLLPLGIVLAACGCGGLAGRGSDAPAPTAGDAGTVPDAAALTFDDADAVSTSVCVRDWVVPAHEPTLAASLAVDAPKLLWSLQLAGYPSYRGTGPVVSGERLVLNTSSHLFLVAKDGSRIEDVAGPLDIPVNGATLGPWSGPTTDREGNIYLVAWSGIFSLAADGHRRWQTSFPGTTYATTGGEFPTAYQYPPAVLSTDGVLFAVTSDQRLHALDSRNGAELWSSPAPLYAKGAILQLPQPEGGGGDRLMFFSAGDQVEYVLDAATGATVGRLQQFCAASTLGAFGWTMAVECANGAASFDTCHLPPAPDGTPRTRDRFYAGLIAPGERLVMFDFTPDRIGYPTDPSYLTLYNRDGSIAAGPVPARGWPSLVGADGTIYTSECVTTSPLGTFALRILAYSFEMKELWRFDQPGGCGRGIYGAVLDEGGVLYVTRDDDQMGSTNLLAIQTNSPGLANSSWPTSAHDNHGTGWLGQPVREMSSLDGGLDAVAGPVDSGDDAP
jgi:outer membrane protein assembly factor BamB